MPGKESNILKKISENRINSLISILLLFMSIGYVISHTSGFFFWDTISQVSAPANWYYYNDFRSVFVPDDIATGHPSFFAIYLAITWKILGRSLFVSHLAMLPFLFGILYQTSNLLKRTESGIATRCLIMAALFADTSLLSQMSLVTFDVPQIFFFLWSINALLNSRKFNLAIAFTGLCMISLRGSLSGFGIILFLIITEYSKSGRITLRGLTPLLPGLIFLLLFFLLFYQQKHWVIHNSVSGRWQQSSEFASFNEIFRNAGIIIWRLIDYGRIGVWIVLTVILLKAVRQRTFFDEFYRNTILIAATQLLVLSPFLLLYRNFIGHRYLLPVLIMASVSSFYWILKYSRHPKLIYSLLIVLLASGHFLIYPERIAQGWDSTTAHWPYYKLRNEMIEKMEATSISSSSTGSFFPNIAPIDDIDLSGRKCGFKRADLNSDSLILFSNIFNVPDHLINELYDPLRWNKRIVVERRGVFLILFEKQKSP